MTEYDTRLFYFWIKLLIREYSGALEARRLSYASLSAGFAPKPSLKALGMTRVPPDFSTLS